MAVLAGLFILCSETYDCYAEQARRLGWEVVIGPRGHLAMINEPELTAAALQRRLA